MTQGGNLDYGLRQYVSAVEFKAGPTANLTLPRIESKNARSWNSIIPPYQPVKHFSFKGDIPQGHLPSPYAFAAINENTGRKYQITYNSTTNATQLTTAASTLFLTAQHLTSLLVILLPLLGIYSTNATKTASQT